MFERLFVCPTALCRHRDGPLSAERASYLQGLVAHCSAHATVVRRARYCLCVAEEVQCRPPTHRFSEDEVDALALEWAAKRVASGRASSARWPQAQFRFVAIDFLRSIGRLRSRPAQDVARYAHELTDFIATQKEGRWSSRATCRNARWQVSRFLDYLEQRDVALADVVPTDVDSYFRHMAHRWSRNSLRMSAKILRAWFAHCEKRRWVRAGLADAVLLPRVYRHEGLPLGPTWDKVGRMLDDTAGEDVPSLRDHCIILLLSVYGLRSGEVRRLQLDDIDWARDRVRIVRSKTGREDLLPLEPRVGNAIARYVRQGRPKTDGKVLFLTLRAPHRALSTGGLYHVVRRHFPKTSSPKKGRGPHGLRHACARHLLEAGRTFKEVGDHLGHRSPDATRIYAKVDLVSLRQVAFDDLGGLA